MAFLMLTSGCSSVLSSSLPFFRGGGGRQRRIGSPLGFAVRTRTTISWSRSSSSCLFLCHAASRKKHESTLWFGHLFFSRRPSSSSSSTLKCEKISRLDESSDSLVTRVSFLTDVEGDCEYLNRYVNTSKLLCFRPTNQTISRELPFPFPYKEWIDFEGNNSMLVFGGDVWDQGGSDLYVIRQLLQLKERFPSRVFFVAGNRDLNKLRLLRELGLPGSSTAPPHAGIRWHCATTTHKNLAASFSDTDMLSNCPVDRLKWMLQKTMGSPRAFEYRRLELSQLNGGKLVSDREVVESYRTSCQTEMALYLSHAMLALKLGPALFVHGALPLTSPILQKYQDEVNSNNSKSFADFWEGDFGKFMPWIQMGNSDKNVLPKTTTDWLQQLNEFCRESVRAWKLDYETLPQNFGIWSTAGGYNNECAPTYGNLLQYGMGWTPDGVRNPTVVYSSWSPSGIPPTHFVTDSLYVGLVRSFFKSIPGLRIIFTGHQPVGDMPNAICVNMSDEESREEPTTGELAWIISADTSYSGTVLFDRQGDKPPIGKEGSKSGRGLRAISEVVLEWKDNGNVRATEVPVVYCHGILSDGMSYETQALPMREHDNVHSLGKLTSDGWWTRAVFKPRPGKSAVVLQSRSGQNYTFYNRFVPGSQADQKSA